MRGQRGINGIANQVKSVAGIWDSSDISRKRNSASTDALLSWHQHLVEYRLHEIQSALLYKAFLYAHPQSVPLQVKTFHYPNLSICTICGGESVGMERHAGRT